MDPMGKERSKSTKFDLPNCRSRRGTCSRYVGAGAQKREHRSVACVWWKRYSRAGCFTVIQQLMYDVWCVQMLMHDFELLYSVVCICIYSIILLYTYDFHMYIYTYIQAGMYNHFCIWIIIVVVSLLFGMIIHRMVFIVMQHMHFYLSVSQLFEPASFQDAIEP